MHSHASSPFLLLPIALAIALLAVACDEQPAPVAGNTLNEQPLVPADPAALKAYLERAVELHLPDGRLLRESDPTFMPDVAAAAPSFSTTNLQTAGVDEADIVKFDGETLFVARQPVYFYDNPRPLPLGRREPGITIGSTPLSISPVLTPIDSVEPAGVALYAAREDPAEAEQIAFVELGETTWIHGMLLLAGDDEAPPLLAVIGNDRDETWPAPLFEDLSLLRYGDTHVRLWILDVSDPREPRVIHDAKVEGSLVAVRRVGEQLVLVTRFTPWVPYLTTESSELTRTQVLEELGLDALLPRRTWVEPDAEEQTGPLVVPERCFVPREHADALPNNYYHPTLVTITMLDLRAPNEPVSVCAAGPVQRIYSSTGALYLASTDWRLQSRTIVHKFAYTERGPEFRGSGTAKGRPGGSNPDFGLGEVVGALGIVTTALNDEPGSIDWAPRLTLLAEARDGSRRLEELSHLPNEREPDRIGKPGEMLHAVRFVGHRIYAVTFRRIDPLYVIDIEDPHNPFIAGELEVPGFSDLLQPVGPNLLLGVGKDSVADVANDWFQGVKVELFDVSDPSAPVSVDHVVIGRRGSETSARGDHHALSALELGDGTTRVAIPIAVAEEPPAAGETDDPRAWWGWSRTGLHLFEVDRDTRSLRQAGALIIAEAEEGDDPPSVWNGRSRLQGEAVHYLHDGRVWSAPWQDPGASVGPH
jgi:hypothetical protein